MKKTPLKRSGFKTKQSAVKLRKTPLRAKSGLRKAYRLATKSKKPISKIQRDLWEECKRIVRATYPAVCFTCGKPVAGSNDHTAHFIPKSVCGAYLKYDLRNLRRCCYYCNVNLGGNGSMYYKRLVETEGQEYVDKLFNDKQITVKAYDLYVELLEQYRQM